MGEQEKISTLIKTNQIQKTLSEKDHGKIQVSQHQIHEDISVQLNWLLLCAPPDQSSNLFFVGWNKKVNFQCERSRRWCKSLLSIASRASFAASTLAGLSVFGLSEDKRDITLMSWMKTIKSNETGAKKRTYDSFDRMHGHPSLSSIFITILIISGCMLISLHVWYTSCKNERRHTKIDMHTVPSA